MNGTIDLKVLVVDDDEVSRNLLSEVLSKDGFEVILAQSGEEAISILDRGSIPLILSDIRMLEVSGLELLKVVKRISPESVVTLMTGFGSMEGALEAIREGAFDYISKPFKLEDLRNLLQKAKRHFLSNRDRSLMNSTSVEKLRAQGLIGKSPQIVEVYKTVAHAALSRANVLISGERGTGKALIARLIHEYSNQASQPIVSWNPVEGFDTLEKTLSTIENGTFIIDDLTSLSHLMQTKLLQFIEKTDLMNRSVRFIGLMRERLQVGARQINPDLYSRLRVISFEIPPLRERIEDLSDLAHFFLVKHSDKNGKSISHLSDSALELLRSYSWPENVRELERAIERAVVWTRGSILQAEDFSELKRVAVPSSVQTESASGTIESMEKVHILRVLEETDYNKSRASAVLGIDRATLYRKAKHYHIELRRNRE